MICCARLGENSQTENHNEAAAPLAKADQDSVKHLRTLLGMKTSWLQPHPGQYSRVQARRPSRRGAARDSRRMHATGAT